MPVNCLLYYITDRTTFPGDEQTRRTRLLDKIAEAASAGVDYIQLREKDLSTRDLETLAREAVKIVRENQKLTGDIRKRPTLLINSRVDLALAADVHGVHLPANDISPEDVRLTWGKLINRNDANSAIQKQLQAPVISIACHSPEDVTHAAEAGVTLALFAPVFEKKDAREVTAQGLAKLQQAAFATIPVLALGGVTLENADSCLRAGAAGIAAIRLFQENEIQAVVHSLRRKPA
jgi:thiamine-phosphate pyrophosphorylase